MLTSRGRGDVTASKAFRLTVLVSVGACVLASHASAQAFFFSTGNPNGLMATASRPAGNGLEETESADDFILTAQTSLTSATFTGLFTTPVSLMNGISQVRVEIYRVFPLDSDVGRTSGPPTFSTSQVPTRVNSPSDVEFVDRDSTAGNLTFTPGLLNSSFTANNSVDTGIQPTPNQTTGGDGAVTGEEVQLNVTFTTPLDLPADHYFFVPQVLPASANNHFLWLSARGRSSRPEHRFLLTCKSGSGMRLWIPTGSGLALTSSAAGRSTRLSHSPAPR